ncbi:MAG: SDR family NAD(P)-dependent oxidoreductase [Bilophila wadsworthia]
MDLRIKDKVYLVTGGGSGIGGGISVALAREGAIPVILGRSPLQKSFRAEVRALQPLMHFIQIELTDEQACADAVQEAVSMYGRIDGLINCAGGHDNVSLETGVGHSGFRLSATSSITTRWRTTASGN